MDRRTGECLDRFLGFFMIRRLSFALPCLALVGSSAGATILRDDSFDLYTTGALAGQQGWIVNAEPQEAYQIGAGQTGQGIVVDSGGLFASGWAHPMLEYVPVPELPVIRAEVSLVAGTFSPSPGGNTSSRFGLEIWNADDVPIARLAMRFTTPGSSQALLAYSVSGGDYTEIPFVAPAGTWRRFRIDLNTVQNTATFFVDDVPVLGNSLSYAVPDTLIKQVDLSSEPTGWDIGRFDNYKISAVPEPASLLVLGLGIASLRRRRR